jgi:trimethylamine--corrinoid protein Co-methyltransferase
MSVAEDTNRRRGGREARKAMRSRAIPVDEAAVRPGHAGRQVQAAYSRPEIEKIHGRRADTA